MQTSNKRVAIIVSILLIAGSLGYLAFGNFGENIVYFVTPSEVKAFTQESFSKKVRVGGMAKGAAMLAPSMATMLAVVTTDAAVSRDILRTLLQDRRDFGTVPTSDVGDHTDSREVVVVENRASFPTVDASHGIVKDASLLRMLG